MQETAAIRAYPFWVAWANRPRRAVGWTLAVALFVVGATLSLEGTATLGWRAVTRHTAQVAFPLFLAAFLASSIARLWPGAISRALLARRRALGLAFATAQIIHGIAIVIFASFEPTTFEIDGAFLGGALGFVFVVAMAATSNDAAARRLGSKAWRALHTSGQVTLFVIYAVTYAGRVAENSRYWPGPLLLVAALGLRLAAAAHLTLRSRTLPIE